MNFPNKLTILRICLVPLFIVCFYLPFEGWNYIAAALFVIAFITDIIDGRYARKHNIVTNFGKLMDPMADKLFVCSAFIMLVSWGAIHAVVAVVVIAREFIVSAFRLVAVEGGKVIAASWLGKIKTVTQCVAVTLVLLKNPLFSLIGVPFDQIMVYVSVVFTIWSGIDYIVKNKKNIDFKN
jgi:CDP-diacylglycerol--glycerol-3-phosphate 3-phosphatidyltransferase